MNEKPYKDYRTTEPIASTKNFQEELTKSNNNKKLFRRNFTETPLISLQF